MGSEMCIRDRATAIGIDEIGGLVVRLEDGSVITLRSGEITVRPRCTKKS